MGQPTLFAVRLGGHILTILGDIADKEVRMVEHHEILFAAPLSVIQRSWPIWKASFARVSNLIELRFHPRMGLELDLDDRHAVPGTAS